MTIAVAVAIGLMITLPLLFFPLVFGALCLFRAPAAPNHTSAGGTRMADKDIAL